MSAKAVDPVVMEIIGGELDSIAKEMAHKLIRSAYSVIIRESEDMGCAILNTDCEEMAESDNTPLHVGSLIAYTKGALETLERRGIELKPGDVIAHNHPYLGASHSLDIAVIVPVFVDGKLVAYSANTAHHVDLGGARPGAAVDLFDMQSEGVIFNATHLYREGVRQDIVWNLFEDNTRAPRAVLGDLACQVAAAKHGEQRLVGLAAKWTWAEVHRYSQALLDYTEQMMRKEIERIPDGTYHASGWLDDDGIHRDVPERIAVTVTVKGSDISVDLSDAPPQRPNSLNTPFEGSTKVAIYSLIRMLLLDSDVIDAYIPANSGVFRPIEVIAKKGTIFNPNPPAATIIRFNPSNRVADLVIQALAPAMPGRTTAGNSAQLNAIYTNGWDDEGNQWITVEVSEGSHAARTGKDGLDAVDSLCANIRNQPMEDLELHLPYRFHRYELTEDEFGHGQWRGGTSTVREYEFLTWAEIVTESERHSDIDPPPGVFGGTNGRPGRFWHVKADGTRERLYSKVNAHRFAPGDRLTVEGVTSGGYGDPLDRDALHVREDVLDGLVSVATARDVYGVLFLADGEIDPRTEAHRQDLKARKAAGA